MQLWVLTSFTKGINKHTHYILYNAYLPFEVLQDQRILDQLKLSPEPSLHTNDIFLFCVPRIIFQSLKLTWTFSVMFWVVSFMILKGKAHGIKKGRKQETEDRGKGSLGGQETVKMMTPITGKEKYEWAKVQKSNNKFYKRKKMSERKCLGMKNIQKINEKCPTTVLLFVFF